MIQVYFWYYGEIRSEEFDSMDQAREVFKDGYAGSLIEDPQELLEWARATLVDTEEKLRHGWTREWDERRAGCQKTIEYFEKELA